MPKRLRLELLSFGNLLCTDFTPSNIANTLQVKTIEQLTQEVSKEGTRIINIFKNACCQNLKESHLERYLQSHQREAIYLMDLCGKYMQDLKEVLLEQKLYKHAISLYQTVTAVLRSILNYIRNDQSKYFNLNLTAPDSYRIRSTELINSDLNVLKAKLKSKSTAPELQQTILDYLSNQCSCEHCSYKQLMQAKSMMDNMLRLLSVNRDIDWDKEIIVNLIYLNFNTEGFYTYCKRYIAASVDAELTFAAQIAKFSWYAKEIKNIRLQSDIAGKSDKPSLSEHILTYISLELVHITMMQSQACKKESATDLNERADKLNFKLPLNLSVAQLAVFIELFIRMNIILIEKGKTMSTIDFIAKNARTIGTDTISALSLNKCRKPDIHALAWMQGTLKTMTNVLEEMMLE